MGKAINSLVNQADEISKGAERYPITYKEFEPHVLPVRKTVQFPHERVVLTIREVAYCNTIKRKDRETNRVVFENKVSYGTEIVEEVLLPREKALALSNGSPRIVGSAERDNRTAEHLAWLERN